MVRNMFKTEESRLACEKVLEAVQKLPETLIDEKKTSLHIVAGGAAFLGVHPRTDGVCLNIVLSHRLDGPRIVKCEQVSKFRYHVEVDVPGGVEIDPELLRWIYEAYGLRMPLPTVE